MTDFPLRTVDVAREMGVHPNTIRRYEDEGFLMAVPRAENGYRQYDRIHLEQIRLARLVLGWPYVGERDLLIRLVKHAAQDDLNMAMELAYHYLATIRVERTFAEAAIELLERWIAGYLDDISPHTLKISEAAAHLGVSVDMLRNWERSGLLTVPRDPNNGYRQYGTVELNRLRVIRMLVKSGYSLMAVLKMLRQFDAGERHNLPDSLNLPPEDSANEHIEVIADRWLLSLIQLDDRTQAIIRQIRHIITIKHAE